MIYNLQFTIYDLPTMHKYLKSKLVIQLVTCNLEPETWNLQPK